MIVESSLCTTLDVTCFAVILFFLPRQHNYCFISQSATIFDYINFSLIPIFTLFNLQFFEHFKAFGPFSKPSFELKCSYFLCYHFKGATLPLSF